MERVLKYILALYILFSITFQFMYNYFKHYLYTLFNIKVYITNNINNIRGSNVRINMIKNNFSSKCFPHPFNHISRGYI